MEQVTRKLQKMTEHSYCLVIPKEFVVKYGWKERQKMAIKDRGRGVLEIRDWRRS